MAVTAGPRCVLRPYLTGAQGLAAPAPFEGARPAAVGRLLFAIAPGGAPYVNTFSYGFTTAAQVLSVRGSAKWRLPSSTVRPLPGRDAKPRRVPAPKRAAPQRAPSAPAPKPPQNKPQAPAPNPARTWRLDSPRARARARKGAPLAYAVPLSSAALMSCVCAPNARSIFLLKCALRGLMKSTPSSARAARRRL